MEFEEWLLKYFKAPETKIMYKKKSGPEEYSYEDLYKKYKKAFKIDL